MTRLYVLARDLNVDPKAIVSIASGWGYSWKNALVKLSDEEEQFARSIAAAILDGREFESELQTAPVSSMPRQLSPIDVFADQELHEWSNELPARKVKFHPIKDSHFLQTLFEGLIAIRQARAAIAEAVWNRIYVMTVVSTLEGVLAEMKSAIDGSPFNGAAYNLTYTDDAIETVREYSAAQNLPLCTRPGIVAALERIRGVRNRVTHPRPYSGIDVSPEIVRHANTLDAWISDILHVFEMLPESELAGSSTGESTLTVQHTQLQLNQ